MGKYRGKVFLDGLGTVLIHISTYIPSVDKVLRAFPKLRYQYHVDTDLRRQYKVRVDLRRQYDVTVDLKGEEE